MKFLYSIKYAIILILILFIINYILILHLNTLNIYYTELKEIEFLYNSKLEILKSIQNLENLTHVKYLENCEYSTLNRIIISDILFPNKPYNISFSQYKVTPTGNVYFLTEHPEN